MNGFVIARLAEVCAGMASDARAGTLPLTHHCQSYDIMLTHWLILRALPTMPLSLISTFRHHLQHIIFWLFVCNKK